MRGRSQNLGPGGWNDNFLVVCLMLLFLCKFLPLALGFQIRKGAPNGGGKFPSLTTVGKLYQDLSPYLYWLCL